MFRKLSMCMPLLMLSVTAMTDNAAVPVAVARQVATGAQQNARKAAATKPAKADTAAEHELKAGGDVQMSGMSVLGNDEAPKSLVIVPWKSSQLGNAPGISKLLDDSTQPVDKEVFLRELAYYQIKSGSK
jgi:hypothetical protein